MDLEMPGPVRRRGKHLIDAFHKGLIEESYIEASASRILELLYKTGKSTIPDWKEGQERAVDLPKHREILRRSGAEGMQYLKKTSDFVQGITSCRNRTVEKCQVHPSVEGSPGEVHCLHWTERCKVRGYWWRQLEP